MSPARRAIFCTGNAHKVEELAALLPDFELEALPAGTVLPPEIGNTFTDNARIKAHAGHALYPDSWVIADDSGLSVDALKGAPGVRSARFAGAGATDIDNTQKLLDKLRKVQGDAARGARFTCVLVAIAPDGTEYIAKGEVEGHIAGAPVGNAGFGYDPVFVPTGERETFAQLGADAKANLSHRARAASSLLEQLLQTV